MKIKFLDDKNREFLRFNWVWVVGRGWGSGMIPENSARARSDEQRQSPVPGRAAQPGCSTPGEGAVWALQSGLSPNLNLG